MHLRIAFLFPFIFLLIMGLVPNSVHILALCPRAPRLPMGQAYGGSSQGKAGVKPRWGAEGAGTAAGSDTQHQLPALLECHEGCQDRSDCQGQS